MNIVRRFKFGVLQRHLGRALLIGVLGGATVMSLIGCNNKTVEEQSEATKLIHEQRELVREIQSYPRLTLETSDADLDQMEAKLNRLEQVERRLDELNGRSGITVTGAQNQAKIDEHRRAIATVREKRQRLASIDQLTGQYTTLLEELRQQWQAIDPQKLHSSDVQDLRDVTIQLDSALKTVGKINDVINAIDQAEGHTPGVRQQVIKMRSDNEEIESKLKQIQELVLMRIRDIEGNRIKTQALRTAPTLGRV